MVRAARRSGFLSHILSRPRPRAFLFCKPQALQTERFLAMISFFACVISRALFFSSCSAPAPATYEKLRRPRPLPARMVSAIRKPHIPSKKNQHIESPAARRRSVPTQQFVSFAHHSKHASPRGAASAEARRAARAGARTAASCRGPPEAETPTRRSPRLVLGACDCRRGPIFCCRKSGARPRVPCPIKWIRAWAAGRSFSLLSQ
jgi:hypothetical protein